MKKIIKNKIYDTETAEYVGEWENTTDLSNFHRVHETLYRKKNGEYFLHGEGGGLTQYAKQVEMRGFTSGENLVPLEYEAARAWAEEHLDADEYIDEFGEIEDDDSTVRMNYMLPTAAVEKVRRIAAQRGVTQSQIIADLIATL